MPTAASWTAQYVKFFSRDRQSKWFLFAPRRSLASVPESKYLRPKARIRLWCGREMLWLPPFTRSFRPTAAYMLSFLIGCEMGHERQNNNIAGGDLWLPDLCALVVSSDLSTQAILSVSQQALHLRKFR